MYHVFKQNMNGVYKKVKTYKKKNSAEQYISIHKGTKYAYVPELVVGLELWSEGKPYGIVQEINEKHYVIKRFDKPKEKSIVHFDINQYKEKFYKGLFEVKEDQ